MYAQNYDILSNNCDSGVIGTFRCHFKDVRNVFRQKCQEYQVEFRITCGPDYCFCGVSITALRGQPSALCNLPATTSVHWS